MHKRRPIWLLRGGLLASLLFGGALLASGQPISGFTLALLSRDPGGGTEDWQLQLYPNGRLAFRGSHRPHQLNHCSADGGRFEVSVKPLEHERLSGTALAAAREQKSLSANEKPARAHDAVLSLGAEYGKEIIDAQVTDQSQPATKEFLSLSEVTMNKLFSSPLQAARFSARMAGGEIEVQLRNIGPAAIPIVLPTAAEDAFYMLTARGRVPLSYSNTPADRESVLKAGAVLTLRLHTHAAFSPKTTVVGYANREALHHSTTKPAPPVLSLCAPLTGGAK